MSRLFHGRRKLKEFLDTDTAELGRTVIGNAMAVQVVAVWDSIYSPIDFAFSMASWAQLSSNLSKMRIAALRIAVSVLQTAVSK